MPFRIHRMQLAKSWCGFTSLEAAKVLTDCVQSDMAAEHAQRAVRLLEGDFNALLQSLYCLATVHFHLSLWEHLLADVDDIWMKAIKRYGEEDSIKTKQEGVERPGFLKIGFSE
nr:unnamed protein product [Haemonchus contortus]